MYDIFSFLGYIIFWILLWLDFQLITGKLKDSSFYIQILDSNCRSTFNYLIIILSYQSFYSNFLYRRWLSQKQPYFLLITNNMFNEPFKILKFLKHKCYIKLVYSLLSCLINLYTDFPGNFITDQCFNPIKYLIFKIEEVC